MARSPGLSAPSLSPFGSTGAGFGAFSIIDPGREAAIAFAKAQNAWQLGQLSDSDYIKALTVYRDAQPPASDRFSNIDQQLQETTYRVNRNVLVSQVTNGTKDIGDLLSFDQHALEGMNPDSEAYRSRLASLQSTQGQVLNRSEKTMIAQYQDGTITSAQLQSWYRSQLAGYTDNQPLTDQINQQIKALDDRIQSERDSQAVSDYSAGKMSDDNFLLYANDARARYATGTTQATEWDKRIDGAQQAKAEDGLLYRYGLSQQYLQLQQFVDSNSAKALAGGKSTSTSTREILGADGQWHSVTTTSTKATAPTPAEQAAYAKLQTEITDAKRQMADLVGKIGSTPDQQGWVSTDTVLAYYQARQADLTKGSQNWYALQQKIDSLNDQKNKEAALANSDVKVTYPSTGGGTAATSSGGGGASTGSGVSSGGGTSAAASTTIDKFMAAIANVESGGRYDAKNATTGAFGKYQIMPANWPAWAQKYLGNSQAAQTPDNQEKVATAKMQELYKWLGSWQAVAYWWNHGGTKDVATNPANWSNGYVGKVMGNLGLPVPASATSAPPSSSSSAPAQGAQGLSTIVSVNRPYARSGTENLTLAGANLPTNMDSAAFTKFYAAYTAAFKAGEESFVDLSSGKPVAYFIGSDVNDRAARMTQLDDLRIQMLTVRRDAYAGTPTEIAASGQLNTAYQDAAAHQYAILDSLTQAHVGAKGTTAAPAQGPSDLISNPLAAGIRGLDKLEAGINDEVAAAKAAYERGDVGSALAHMQLARSLQQASITSSGANKGQAAGTVVELGKYASAAQAIVDKVKAAYGVGPEDVLGAGANATFAKDLTRLESFGQELDALTGKGSELDKLATTVKSQIKTDPAGNVIYDNHGGVTLADGFARFADANGKVTIQPTTKGPIDPDTGLPSANMAGFTKTVVKIGTTVEDVYAKWTADVVGYMKNPQGKNIPIMGKIVTLNIDGKPQTFYENPFQPGSWSDHAVVLNSPVGLGTTPNADGTSSPQIVVPSGGKANDYGDLAGATITFSFDKKTGTYLLVANKPGGFMQDPIVNRVLGGSGAQNVLDLMKSLGMTMDTKTTFGGQFTNIGTPTFGMTADQLDSYLHPVAPALLGKAADDLSIRNMLPTLLGKAADDTSLAAQVAPLPGKAADDTYLAGSLPKITPLPAVTGTALPGKAADDLVLPKATPPSPTTSSQPSASTTPPPTGLPPAQRPDATLPPTPPPPLPKVTPLPKPTATPTPLVKPGQGPIAS